MPCCQVISWSPHLRGFIFVKPSFYRSILFFLLTVATFFLLQQIIKTGNTLSKYTQKINTRQWYQTHAFTHAYSSKQGFALIHHYIEEKSDENWKCCTPAKHLTGILREAAGVKCNTVNPILGTRTDAQYFARLYPGWELWSWALD